ncbi:protoglobin domain-containing protein [Sporolactobacillus kofuensis]|uniref:Protoglobin domain-containing protein n=1 Tax=Sporolactobacillus kofuensis TaxID=269672 RepID=A0ABW1WJ42_9BACL|nr:globin-coupled sensor protein [Sporolactobacillus kofuensis]MCO7176873.1 globin-coupled sensor protein [Sporolactobacillus kofuensis]
MPLLKKRASKQSWIDKAKSEKVTIDVTDSLVLEKIQMLRITDADLQVMKMLHPLVEKEINRIAEEFYESFSKIDSLRKIIDNYSSVEKLSRTLATHVLELFSGVIDKAFLDRRYRVGVMHFRIGLTPQYYMGTFQSLLSNLIEIVLKHGPSTQDVDCAIRCINKLISFEQQLVLEAYDNEYEKSLKKEYEIGRTDLKTSILGVSDDLIALSERSKQLVDHLQNQFKRVRANSNQRSEYSENTKKHAAEGQEQLEQLFVQVMAANTSVQDTGKMVAELETSSKQIEEVTVLVKDISEQTHILAINSAIEAARAGEYGKGFTVVAQEIQKLAEATNNAMGQISELIKRSATVTGNVVGSLEKTTSIIQKSMEESTHTGERFEGIIDSADQNSRLSSVTDQSIDKLAEITHELSKGVETLVASAEQLKNKL